MMNRYSISILLGIFLFSCSVATPKRNPGKSYFDGNKFQNLNPGIQAPGFMELLKWQTTRLFSSRPSLDPKDYIISTYPNDGTSIRNNKDNFSITWIGHATVLVQIEGINILTDPIWSERCSPVSFAGPKRYTNPGLTLDQLPKIDLVIISHNHYDHMDTPTLLQLEKKFKPLFIVGLKNREFLIREGLERVMELDWWEATKFSSLDIFFTPTQHTSARGIFDRDKTLWGSFVIKGVYHSVYFAGDTGYFPEFKLIGDKFNGIDYAILPIGAYEPRWFMKPVHMNPEESIQAFLDLRSKFLVPIHYHTFVLTDEGLDEPLIKTRKLFSDLNAEDKNLLQLSIGETYFAPLIRK